MSWAGATSIVERRPSHRVPHCPARADWRLRLRPGAPHRVRLPFGSAGLLGDAVADFEQNLEVFHGAVEIPIGFDHVRCIVVVVRDIVRALLWSKASRFPNILDSGSSFERGDADAGEFVVVGAEVEAELRGCISGKNSALALNGFGGEIVQRGIADTNNAEVLARPHPQLLK